MCSQTQVKHVLSTFILSMQASIFSCSTAFLAWEMLAVLLLAIPSFMVLLWHQTQAQKGDTESMNITLNPKSSIPLATFLPPSPQLEKPFSATTFLFKKDPFCLRGGGGGLFYSSQAPFYLKEQLKKAAAGQPIVILQSLLMNGVLLLLVLESCCSNLLKGT